MAPAGAVCVLSSWMASRLVWGGTCTAPGVSFEISLQAGHQLL